MLFKQYQRVGQIVGRKFRERRSFPAAHSIAGCASIGMAR
jgi:hypothetical protein